MGKNLLILDAGHNEYVAGKRSPDNSLLEWVFNDDMQHLIKKRAEDHGIEVYLTNPSPAKKDEIGLATRCNLANNKWKALNKPTCLFVSIHANAYGNGWTTANGTETFVANKASSSSVNAGKLINAQIVKDIGTRDRTSGAGIKRNDYYVIKNTSMPAVLIEYAFYSNKTEVEILKNKKPELAEATIKGICAHFGITYVPAKTTTSGGSTNTGTATTSEFSKGNYNKPVEVTADNLNVREGRGTSYSVIGSLNKGDVVEMWYIDAAKDGTLWGSIGINGKTGFISTSYVKPTTKNPTPSNTNNSTSTTLKPIAAGDYNAPLKVTATSLNVRSGRGTKYKVVSTLKKDTIIDAWRIEKGDDGKLWTSFRYGPTTTPETKGVGYCSCEFLTPSSK